MSELDVKSTFDLYQLMLIHRAIKDGEPINCHEERLLLWSTIKEIEYEKFLNTEEVDSKI